MTWNDNATWNDLLTWVDAVGYSAITAEVVDKSKDLNTAPVTWLAVESMVPVARISTGDITADTTLTDFIPAGIVLENILIVNTTANAGQISAGTAVGGTDLFAGQAIAAYTGTVIQQKRYFETATSLYLSDVYAGDNWNSMNITIYLLYWKLYE